MPAENEPEKCEGEEKLGLPWNAGPLEGARPENPPRLPPRCADAGIAAAARTSAMETMRFMMRVYA